MTTAACEAVFESLRNVDDATCQIVTGSEIAVRGFVPGAVIYAFITFVGTCAGSTSSVRRQVDVFQRAGDEQHLLAQRQPANIVLLVRHHQGSE
jgi:hypothetical protein